MFSVGNSAVAKMLGNDHASAHCAADNEIFESTQSAVVQFALSTRYFVQKKLIFSISVPIAAIREERDCAAGTAAERTLSRIWMRCVRQPDRVAHTLLRRLKTNAQSQESE